MIIIKSIFTNIRMIKWVLFDGQTSQEYTFYRYICISYLCFIFQPLVVYMDQMHYFGLNEHLKRKYGEKVFKVSLDIGSTCPNRDGTTGTGGCLFCNPNSLIQNQESPTPIERQLRLGIEYIKKRHGAHKFISYLQHHTNTYGDIKKLRKYYLEALDHKDVVGLAISTRPDAISNDVLELLKDIDSIKDPYNKSSKKSVWIEMGLQSCRNDSLKFLKRGHTVEDFIDSNKKLQNAGIDVIAHIIIGIPGETDDDLLDMAKLLNRCDIRGIKMHNLHILKETLLAEAYERNEIKPLEINEYAKKVVLLIRHLKPDIVIHRLNSHSPRSLTIAPLWSINKLETLNEVEREFERQNAYQGMDLV